MSPTPSTTKASADLGVAEAPMIMSGVAAAPMLQSFADVVFVQYQCASRHRAGGDNVGGDHDDPHHDDFDDGVRWW